MKCNQAKKFLSAYIDDIKIPLEAAGLVLTVVLVVITYRIIEPGTNYYPAKNDMVVKKIMLTSSPAKGYVSEETAVPGQKDIQEFSPTEEAGYKQESLSQEEQEMIAMRTVTKSDSSVKNAGLLAMAGAGKFYDLFIRIMEKDLTLDDASYKVNRIAKAESGIIVFMQTAQDGLSRIIVLSVPARNYESLMNKMKLVGKIQYQALSFGTDSNELLNLRIHLILPQ